MKNDPNGEDTKLTSTRRRTLKLVAGATPTVIFGTGSATAQTQDRQQWAFEAGGSIESPPTVVDDTVFIGSLDTNLYAVDAETGDQQWTFETNGRIF